MAIEIKSAKDLLREMEVTTNGSSTGGDWWVASTDEDHVINALLIFANQFIYKIIEEDKKYKNSVSFVSLSSIQRI